MKLLAHFETRDVKSALKNVAVTIQTGRLYTGTDQRVLFELRDSCPDCL